MYFFTEKDLRMMYKKKAFNQFVLEKHQKLTPEAKQFLSDRKIDVTNKKEKDIANNEPDTEKQATNTEWIGYKEVLSSEILEAYFLGEKIKHKITHRILLLETSINHMLSQEEKSKETSDDRFPVCENVSSYVVNLEGPLLVKLQKVYGLLCLMARTFPEFSHGFREVISELVDIVDTIVGGIDDKRNDITL